jgi:hypothetical protein
MKARGSKRASSVFVNIAHLRTAPQQLLCLALPRARLRTSDRASRDQRVAAGLFRERCEIHRTASKLALSQASRIHMKHAI